MGDPGIRLDAGAINDLERIRGRVTEGIVHDIADGPGQRSGLPGRRHVSGADRRVAEVGTRPAGRRGVVRGGITVDVDHIDKGHAAGQDILHLNTARRAAAQIQRQPIRDGIAHTDDGIVPASGVLGIGGDRFDNVVVIHGGGGGHRRARTIIIRRSPEGAAGAGAFVDR